jgi:Ser/Thr protein kinase RdoA (MazF antagonist)
VGIATRYATAFQHVEGHEPSRSDDLTDTFRTLGAITARMHSHARAWTRPAGFVRKAWSFRTMLGDRALWGDWRVGPGLDRAGLTLLERTVECLRLRLARFGKSPDRFGLIHADLRLTNLLADGGVLNVIDFDDCGFGWFAYDFAASVSFIEDDPAVPELLAAWLEGYRTVAPFARADEAEIPAFVMLRRMLLLAWIASHAEAPEARALAGTYTSGTLALADEFLRRYG